MLSPDALLNNLAKGPAMLMGVMGKSVRKRIIETIQERHQPLLTADDWQHLANALAHPSEPTTPEMQTLAAAIKSIFTKQFVQIMDFATQEYIQKNDLNGEFSDALKARIAEVIAQWDWQMFANGLLADD